MYEGQGPTADDIESNTTVHEPRADRVWAAGTNEWAPMGRSGVHLCTCARTTQNGTGMRLPRHKHTNPGNATAITHASRHRMGIDVEYLDL